MAEEKQHFGGNFGLIAIVAIVAIVAIYFAATSAGVKTYKMDSGMMKDGPSGMARTRYTYDNYSNSNVGGQAYGQCFFDASANTTYCPYGDMW